MENSKEQINKIKVLKNHIFENASKYFIYNLKKLIQVEVTQKKLAKKIGVSEDLLSKYKTGEAFPSIETLVYICELYKLDMYSFITTELNAEALLRLESGKSLGYEFFHEKYYAYFLVTNLTKEGALQEGILSIENNSVCFKILSKERVLKTFHGNYEVSDKLLCINLESGEDGFASINMHKPNTNKRKYVGGLALLSLPSDANSKPCTQKIILSKIRLDRGLHNDTLKSLLSFNIEGQILTCIKVSPADDEEVFNFIESLI